MSLEIGFLVFPRVQQLDLTGPCEVLASLKGASNHLVWKTLDPVASSTGLRLSPTATFATCPPLDVLCIAGGVGINVLLEDARSSNSYGSRRNARAISRPSARARSLGAAGLLRGRRATTHWNAHDLLAHFGAIPTKGRVVRVGNLITAGGVTAGIDFGLALVAELAGQTEAETIQLALEYAPAPPFDSGTPETASANVLAVAKARLAALRQAREAIIARIAPG